MMTRLDTVSIEELEDAYHEATGKRATKRLMVAIIYKRGPSVPMLAEWLDIREQTVYAWFDRLEAEPIEQAVRERDRSGRPPKLDDADVALFREAIRNPPTAFGYDRPEWTVSLARTLLAEEFDVEYSERHVRRLLSDVDTG